MKLRLPHKFQAALMAALASVSITTLSSATAFAETLTQIATMSNLVTSATVGTAAESTVWEIDGSVVYTFDRSTDCYLGGITTVDLSTALTNGDYVTVAAWINTPGHGTSSDGHSIFGYGGGSDGIKVIDQGGSLKMTTKGVKDFGTSSADIGLNEWELVAVTFHKNGSKLDVQYMLDGSYSDTVSGGYMNAPAGQTFAIGSGNGSGSRELFVGSIAGLTVYTSSNWVSATDVSDAMFAKPTERTYTSQTWDGNDTNHSWSDTVWLNGGSGEPVAFKGDDAVFGATGNKTVLVDSAVTAHAVTVSGQGYTFSLQAGGNLTANSLTINGDATGLTIDSAEGATGTLKVNSAISASGKTITVNNGAVLQVATTGSSFTLAGNGTYALADGVYAKDNGVTIGSNWTGTVLVSNTNASQNNQVNDVALTNGNQSTLELSGFKGWLANNRWKAEVGTNIKLTDYVNGSSTRYAWVSEAYSTSSTETMTLTGKWSGTGTYNSAGTNGGTRYMHYNFKGDITDWTGAFLKTSQNTVRTNLTFSENAKNVNIRIDGSGNFGVIVDTDATFSKAVTADTFTVNPGRTATLAPAASNVAYTIGTITNNGTIAVAADKAASFTASGNLNFGNIIMDNGATLNFNHGAEGREHTFSSIALTDGATATINIINNSWCARFNIGAVTGAAGTTLNLWSAAKVSKATVYDMNGGEGSAFYGNVVVSQQQTATTRYIAMNINSGAAEQLQNSVVTLSSNASCADPRVGLGINADSVVVKGIVSDPNATSGTHYIFSGAATRTTDTFDGIGDGKDRTLTIDTGSSTASYSTRAQVGSHLSIEKEGAGTQTFTGDMSAFSGNITVNNGTLALDSAVEHAAAVAVNGGNLALGNSLTTTGAVSVAAGAGITFANGSTITANSLTLTSGAKLDFSAYQGAIGSEIHVVTTASGVTGYEGAVITGPTVPRGMQANVAQEDNDIVLTFQAKEDATMHLYILTGQSNSLGAVKDSPLNASMLAAYQSEGLLWNGNMHKDRPSGANTNRYIPDPDWQVVAPQEPGLTLDAAAYKNNPCMGPEYGFSYIMENNDWAAQLLEADDTLAVVKGSLDGGGNGYWLRDNNAYQTLLDNVKLSIQDAVALGYSNISLDGLMYLQGESNSTTEASQAATRFTDFIGYLKSDLQSWLTENPELTGITLSFDSNTVTGEPRLGSEARQTTETQLLELATSNDMINADKNGKGHVLTNDLAVTNCDGLNVHYTGNSQLTIGARYAYAFAVQKGIDVGAVRGQDDSKTLDQAGAWWMEKLPGETEVATWDISSVSTVNNIADGATLTVGGIKIDEVYSATATAQGQGSIAITGGAISLGQHGINLVGGDLSITSAVTARENQTWQAVDGHKLAVNGTTTIGAGATLTLEDGLHLTFGAITGTGNLEIGHVTLDMSEAYMLANGLGTYRTSTEEVSENGFFTGNLDIVRLTGESSSITFTESGSIASNITQAGDLANYTLSLENGGKALRVNGLTPDPAVYYARSGEVTYTDTDAAQYGIYTAGQLTLSGTTAAPATLTLASALKEGVTIKAEGLGGTVNIASGVTLAAASVNAASGPVALAGEGTFALTGTADLPTNVTLADAAHWHGTVKIADTTISSGNIGIKLNELGNENSVVEFENVKAFLNTSSYTYTPNIKLTGEGLNIDAGSTDGTYTFNGDVTGSGTLNLSLSRGSNNHTYVFAGDVAGWEGELKAPTNGRTLTVKFTGEADTVNARITKTGGTLNLVVETDTTFNAAVTGVSSFNIAEGASAVLAGTDAHSISDLTVNSGSSFTIATGATATVTGAVLKNTITNDGTVTLAGTVNLDALTASAEWEGYLDGQTFGNGFRTIEAFVPVFTQGHVGTVNSGDATITYKNVQGTINATTGEFHTGDNEDLSTFYVNKNGTTENYSHAYDKAGASMTAVSLANATTINMDKADATLGTLTLAVGDAGAATMKATANATIGAMNGLATGQTLHFTGDSATPAVLTLNGDNTGRMAGNVDITGVTVKLGNYKSLGAYNGRGAASGTNRTITVGADGVLDMNGAETGGDHGYKITLDGGTLTNTGTARRWSNRQPFTNVVLASDSKAVATNDFGIMASAWNETTLDLQNHVLEVSGAGRFYLSNTTVNAGENGLGTILAKGGTVNFNGNRADANQQGAFAGNLVMAADDNGAAGTIAGRLKLGGTTKVSSTVEGDTPAVVTADINTNGQTLRFEGAQDINVAPGTATGDDYNGRAAISGNGTIEHASTGTTTISGSTANFNGNVDVEAGVLNIMNAASVNVQNVTIGTSAVMGVYNGENVQIDTNSEGKLTIKTDKILTAGSGATLNANLEMAAGSHLDVSADGGVNGLLMGSTVTLNKGMNLEDYSSSVWSTWEDGTKYALFSGVDGLNIGAGMGTEAIDYTQWVDAKEYFTNIEEANRYFLCYDGAPADNQNGVLQASFNGSNVGMVYIMVMPEPTTGTLSLLALCALVARRRRK